MIKQYLSRYLTRWLISQVERWEKQFQNLSDSGLKDAARELRQRAQVGTPTWRLLPEAYGLVRAAAERTLGMRHYDVQLLAGACLSRRCIIEMNTGEGKTLTATFPMFLHALRGRGAHLATSNDYLAARDAEELRPLYEALGMSVGVVTSEMDDDERRAAYRCDITYGTSTEFGFDFLRDRMIQRGGDAGDRQPVMRGLYFILCDEADSLLIDEANTPLIIGSDAHSGDARREQYLWSTKIAPHASENEHYRYDLHKKKTELTAKGRVWVREQLRNSNLGRSNLLELYEMLEKAILVHRDYHRDKQYVVRDGEIVIVNEQTGRLGVGRQWQDGIHQAIQAAEGVEITMPSSHAARITVQSFFLAYQHLAGMSGTALVATRELAKVYKLMVQTIPTHRPTQRKALKPSIASDCEAKLERICDEIIEMHNTGRPVLVGTRSVESSETLSQRLHDYGITHQVLNAQRHDEEAAIIAQAGQLGRVTVATNMAGRGTDIHLSEQTRRLGGLHVILTEFHDSPRADQQLIGRCGRQGDPGSYRQFLCPDDEILSLGYGERTAETMRDRLRQMPKSRRVATLSAAQMRLESRKRRSRSSMLYHEKRRLRKLYSMGLDPLLDAVD